MLASQPIVATLEKPRVTLTLRRRSPAWELTLHNTGATSLCIDNRLTLPADDRLTISRRIRTPTFNLQISDRAASWYTPGNARTLRIEPAGPTGASVTVTTTFAEPVPTLPVRLEFKPIPPTVTARMLPLEVTVLPPHAGESGYTLVRYRNTGTVPLTADGCPFPAGGTLTFTGKDWAASFLHGVKLSTPDGTTYSVEVCPLRPTNGRFRLWERLLYGPLPPPPAPAPPACVYRCTEPPMDVIVDIRGLTVEYIFHNTSETNALYVGSNKLLPGAGFRTSLGTHRIMVPISARDDETTGNTYNCTVMDIMTARLTPKGMILPLPAVTLVLDRKLVRSTEEPAAVPMIVDPLPAPAPAPADPHFDAATFYPHVLQQFYIFHLPLLTGILRKQGLTPGQITAFLESVAEL